MFFYDFCGTLHLSLIFLNIMSYKNSYFRNGERTSSSRAGWRARASRQMSMASISEPCCTYLYVSCSYPKSGCSIRTKYYRIRTFAQCTYPVRMYIFVCIASICKYIWIYILEIDTYTYIYMQYRHICTYMHIYAYTYIY